MDLRIQKELYKAVIDLEDLFTRSEKLLLKIAGECAQSTRELSVITMFCYLSTQYRVRCNREALRH